MIGHILKSSAKEIHKSRERPDQSERVERSPFMQTYPPWNVRNYHPWKRIPLELNCSRPRNDWQQL